MLSRFRPGLLTLCLLLAACSTPRPLPKFEKPLARTRLQTVRTTAYTDTETDHRPYGTHNALGGTLSYGPVQSAAADWSRWPAGTMFRIQQTGELYQVDDYGWALAGTNTIDLYKSSRAAMNAWGVHRVDIEILQWGDISHCYAVLKPRGQYAHVRRMLKEIEDGNLRKPDSVSPVIEPSPATQVVASVDNARWPKAQAVGMAAAPAAAPQNAVANNPFFR